MRTAIHSRLVITIIGALAATAATAAAAALAANPGPSPTITGGVLGSGGLTLPRQITVHLSRSNGFVVENGTFPPHTTAGWHFHRTPVTVAITAGTLTLYDSSGPKCTPHRYHAGQGFIEPANHIHMARNEGTSPATIVSTYIDVPPKLRKNPNNLDVFNQKRPAKCPPSVH